MQPPSFDVIIPLGPQDESIVQKCIDSVYTHVVGVRNVFVISHRPIQLSDCIVLQESAFPFKKADVEKRTSTKKAGWYLQQLIKLYAPLLISNILENVLVVDADTIFYKRTRFLENGQFLFDKVTGLVHEPYFIHMKKLHPSFTQWKKATSGITNVMIFNKKILSEIFEKVETHHNDGRSFWEIFLDCVTEKESSGASEYELYFNYVMSFHFDQVRMRPLQWSNDGQRVNLEKAKGDWHYVNYHIYRQSLTAKM